MRIIAVSLVLLFSAGTGLWAESQPQRLRVTGQIHVSKNERLDDWHEGWDRSLDFEAYIVDGSLIAKLASRRGTVLIHENRKLRLAEYWLKGDNGFSGSRAYDESGLGMETGTAMPYDYLDFLAALKDGQYGDTDISESHESGRRTVSYGLAVRQLMAPDGTMVNLQPTHSYTYEGPRIIRYEGRLAVLDKHEDKPYYTGAPFYVVEAADFRQDYPDLPRSIRKIVYNRTMTGMIPFVDVDILVDSIGIVPSSETAAAILKRLSKGLGKVSDRNAQFQGTTDGVSALEKLKQTAEWGIGTGSRIAILAIAIVAIFSVCFFWLFRAAPKPNRQG